MNFLNNKRLRWAVRYVPFISILLAVFTVLLVKNSVSPLGLFLQYAKFNAIPPSLPMILSLFAITVSLILYTRTRLHPFSWVLPWVLPAALISWACLNFAWWEKINKEDLYRLRPHNKTGLYELAVNDPDPWVRSTLAMYYFMRDTMGGKTVFTYSSSDVFISQYLHSIAGIKGIFFKPYNYLLAANEVEYLLALPHAKHGHFDGKTFFFCFDGNIASKNEAFYMMSDGKDIFVVSGETFIRMRGQA